VRKQPAQWRRRWRQTWHASSTSYCAGSTPTLRLLGPERDGGADGRRRDDYGSSMDAKTTTAAAIMRSLSKLKLPGTSPTLSSRQRGEEGPRGGCRSTRRMRPADSLLANLFTGASAVKAPYAQLKDPAGGSKDATAVARGQHRPLRAHGGIGPAARAWRLLLPPV
jgi:hypothetical protein